MKAISVSQKTNMTDHNMHLENEGRGDTEAAARPANLSVTSVIKSLISHWQHDETHDNCALCVFKTHAHTQDTS